jgi:LysM repeat protein
VSRRRRKPKPGLAHYAAPAALLLGVTIAVLLIHQGLQQHEATTTAPGATLVTTTTTPAHTKPGPKKRFYTVQTGDTFGSIAATQGITVDRLQELNPGVSSNALQVGQRLRVR